MEKTFTRFAEVVNRYPSELVKHYKAAGGLIVASVAELKSNTQKLLVALIKDRVLSQKVIAWLSIISTCFLFTAVLIMLFSLATSKVCT